MRFPYGVTATVSRPGGRDGWGNPLPSTEHTVPDCAPAPAGSSEATGTDEQVTWDVDLLCSDPAADFASGDTVSLPGDPESYQVEGKPRRYVNPFTGWEAGCVVRLKGVTG